MTKKLQIRNSTADFLIFTKENNSADTIEVRGQDGNVWLTQKASGRWNFSIGDCRKSISDLRSYGILS